MMYKLFLVLAVAIFAFFTTPVSAVEPVDAPHAPKMVVAVSTDDFELAETDLSHLAIGDAETIHTESGKTIDLLRTEEGIEIYVDGELLELGLDGEEGSHEGHVIVHKRVEVTCENEDECEETVWISDEDEIDLEALHGDGHHEKFIVIRKMVETD